MAGNSKGPWGGGGGGGGRDPWPPRKDGGSPQIPDMDAIVRKGQEKLKVLMGGGGGRGTGGGRSGGGGGLGRGAIVLGLLFLAVLWFLASFYTIKPEERGVELFLGKYYRTTESGPHLAPWPLVKVEIVETTRERTEDIGVGTNSTSDAGLMLTGDENIVDIDFQVVWNISDPADYLFNLADPPETIRAVAESAMREIIAQSELSPILNRDRGIISEQLHDLIQSTLDSYNSGVNIIRVNFDRADPPREVIDAFREVQAAEQERDRLQKQADAYANRVLAQARGEAARLVEEAEAYRAQVVNTAEGEASRFEAVLGEYEKAPDVTRKRLYIETLEKVLADVDKIIIDDQVKGIVPYLPLDRMQGGQMKTGAQK